MNWRDRARRRVLQSHPRAPPPAPQVCGVDQTSDALRIKNCIVRQCHGGASEGTELAYLPAGVFAASDEPVEGSAIIKRCAYGMIVVNRLTCESSDLPSPLSRPIMRPTSKTSA